MLTLALTAHAYLVRKNIIGRAVASNRQTKVLDSHLFTFVVYSNHKHPKYLGRELAMVIWVFVSGYSPGRLKEHKLLLVTLSN